MQDNELCERAREFFARLANEDARAWTHGVIQALRAAYPTIDVWATGGLNQYVDIRIGRRNLGTARGAPVFFLWIDTQSKWPNLWAHEDIRDGILPHPLTAEDAPTLQDVGQWLERHGTQIARRASDLAGKGSNPVDYAAANARVEAGNQTEPEHLVRAPSPSTRQSGLNQILFGPPGTGKTYNTINQALAILEPELLTSGASREVLKAAFDANVASGQIVFATFHQSFSYEDFVEGLRATSTDGQLEYLVEPGVFKRLCQRAALGVVANDDPFDLAIARLLEKLDQVDGRIEMKTRRGRRFSVAYSGGATFLLYPESSQDLKSGYTGSMEHVRKLYQTGDEHGMYNLSYVRGMLDYLKSECSLPATSITTEKAESRLPFVLIIDEINRGNVSRIFGELITLIESSKRTGMPEALEVMLPYSKERFSVPANLHIIGTMNTTDRSLAGLDIALRRRFEFVEMPPRPDLLDGVTVEGVDIGQLLRVMNARIEVLLDRDHCLGHAYFMSLRSTPELSALARIFRNSILPLLQEYFFEDWQRIAWVLNDHRKPQPLCFLRQPASRLTELFGDDANINEQGQRWQVNEEAFEEPGAYAGVIDASLASNA